ncbi:hypothetical protein [Kordiimonas aquimaris]|uniref:hypothetical protein n=1 Tax=Kordiimonas aquimaris TaxID=707591 RepID=UPI0021CE43E6|nr:hypothetical protein [Kordiimonas aquimaris]
MLDRFRSIVVGLSMIVLLGLVGLYLFVQVGGGEELFGDNEGSLPVVDFRTLEYSDADNGYLLCSPELCEKAQPDGPSPIFQMDAGRLRQLFADFSDSNPTIKTFRFNLPASQFDFTERLPGETFPAVVTVKIISLDAYTSTAAIYSRQPIGDSNRSDHVERVSRWIKILTSPIR